MRRAPFRVEAPETVGKVMVESGHERQPRDRGQPGAHAAERAEGDQEGGDGREGVETQAAGGRFDGVDGSLQSAEPLRGQGHQDADRPEEVHESDEGQGDEDGARDGAARVLDLLAHKRRRLEPGQGEGEGRPEDQVPDPKPRSQGRAREFGRRSETRPGHQADGDEGQGRGPAGEGPHVADPFAELQAEQVRHHPERQSQERRDDHVGRAGGQSPPAVTSDVQRVSSREIEDAREVGQVAHPVGPSCHEPREFAEGALAPDVHPPFLRVAGRHLHDRERQWDRHGREGDEPDGQGARTRDAGGGDPLKVDAGGDEVQDDVAEPHDAAEPGGPGGARCGVFRRLHGRVPTRMAKDGRRSLCKARARCKGRRAGAPTTERCTLRASRGGQEDCPGRGPTSRPGARRPSGPLHLDT